MAISSEDVDLTIEQGVTFRKVLLHMQVKLPAGWVGYWNPNVAYEINNVVGANGKHWRALQASTGVLPGSSSAHWQEQLATYEAVDLADFNARMQVRDKPGGSVLFFQLTSDPAAGITMEPGGAKGEVHLEALADKTAAVTKPAWWEVKLRRKSNSLDVVRLGRGRILLSKQVDLHA